MNGMDMSMSCLSVSVSCHMNFQQSTDYSVAINQNKAASVRAHGCFHFDSEKKVVNNNNDQTDCCISMIYDL